MVLNQNSNLDGILNELIINETERSTIVSVTKLSTKIATSRAIPTGGNSGVYKSEKLPVSDLMYKTFALKKRTKLIIVGIRNSFGSGK